MVTSSGFEQYEDALAEIQRLHEVEFIHAGCAGLRERDNEHLIAERDRAREECGHEKAMRASQREEMMRYFTEWKAAEAKVARVEALICNWEATKGTPESDAWTRYVAERVRNALSGDYSSETQAGVE